MYVVYFILFSWIRTKDDRRHISSIADVIRRADERQGVPFGALTSENRDTWTHVRFSSVVVSFYTGIEQSHRRANG